MVDARPLRHVPFRRLWLSTVVTTIGAQLTAVAVPKQLFDDTGSSAWVGLAGLVGLVPLALFSLAGGSIADAVDRRRLLLGASAGIALTSAGLFVQAALQLRSVWLVLGLLAAQQAMFGLSSPAEGAAVPRLVPLEELPAATALSATVFGLGAVIGPLLAGVLIPVIGLAPLYLADASLLLVAVWAAARLPALPPLAEEIATPGLRSVVDGFRYLATRTVLLMSYLADLTAMVFGMPRALFPEMAERSFGDPAGGGRALGLLYAAIPAGAFLGGLFSGTFSRARRQGAAVVLAVAGWGLAVVGFGLSRSLPLAVTFLALAGAADLVSMVFRNAILQTAATDEMRGRMQGVFFLVVAGGPRLADLLHGTAGDLFGTRPTVAAGGLLVVAGIAVLAVRFGVFWRYRPPVRFSASRD